MRRSIKAAASDLTRWDFDQNGPLLAGDLTVRDAGNIMTKPATPGRNRELIRAATRAILDVSAVPVLLGGDDSVPIPFFDAFETHGPITIVQVDAHLDWREERNGIRHTFSSPMRRASEMPWVERIVQVGMRGIGASRKGDLDDALRWGARIISASSVHRHGMKAVLDCIPEGARCVITIDCDGLDPSVIPGVLVPQPGGLSFTDMMALFDGLATKASIEVSMSAPCRKIPGFRHPARSQSCWRGKRRCGCRSKSPVGLISVTRDKAGVDVVELVPSRDVNEIGAFSAARLVCKAIGCIARQRGRAEGT
jgi:agmatinase